MIPRGGPPRVTLNAARGTAPLTSPTRSHYFEDRTMKKARVLLAVVFAAVAVSLSACSETITGAECVDPGGNTFWCE